MPPLISFRLTSHQTSGTLAVRSATDIIVAADGTSTEPNGTGTTRTGWAIDLSNPSIFHLTALGGGEPTDLIIGPPDAGGIYSATSGLFPFS